MELKYYLRGLGLGIAITAVIMGLSTSKSKAMTNEEIIARAKELGMTQDNAVLTEINSNDEDDKDDGQSVDEAGESGTESGQTDGESGQTGAEDNGMMEDGEDLSGAESADMGNDTEKMDPETDAGNIDLENDTENIDSEDDTEDTDLYEEFLANNPGGSTKTTDTGTDAEAGELDTGSSGRAKPASKDPLVITIGRGDGSYSVSKKLEDAGAVASAKDFDNYLCQNGYDKRIRTGTYTIPADASDEQIARIITGKE